MILEYKFFEQCYGGNILDGGVIDEPDIYTDSADTSNDMRDVGVDEQVLYDIGESFEESDLDVGVSDTSSCEKTDPKHLWSKRFGGSYYDYGYSISVDSSGNVYITGYFKSSMIDFGGGALTNAGVTDIFLAKFDSNGNHLWSKRFGGSSVDWGSSVSVDSSGNVYGTGYFGSNVDFGGCPLSSAGGTDIYLIKYAP